MTANSANDLQSPFAAGDWITDDNQIGCVKEVYNDGLLDIVIYDRDGTRLGRTSPTEGGPRGFEPCCEPSYWRRVAKPNFPLRRHYHLREVLFDAPPRDGKPA